MRHLAIALSFLLLIPSIGAAGDDIGAILGGLVVQKVARKNPEFGRVVSQLMRRPSRGGHGHQPSHDNHGSSHGSHGQCGYGGCTHYPQQQPVIIYKTVNQPAEPAPMPEPAHDEPRQESVPESATVYIIRGKELANNDRWEDALPYFQRAIALEPLNLDAHYCAGAVYAKLGNVESAMLEHKIMMAIIADAQAQADKLKYFCGPEVQKQPVEQSGNLQLGD